MKRILVLAALLVIVFATLASAEVPKKISFQGYVSSLSGNPISGQHIFTFRICNGQTGGDTLWTDVDTLTLDRGQFHAYLGKNRSLPITMFSGQILWLETAVDGSTLFMRQPLVSVAYSFRSQVADTAMVALAGGDKSLWETDGTNVWRSSGNVGIGTSTPTSILHLFKTGGSTELALSRGDNANDHAASVYIPSGVLSDTNKLWESGLHAGANDYEVWAWDHDSETLGLSISNTGNVSIGTNASEGPLTVYGNKSGSNVNLMVLRNTATSNGAMAFAIGAPGAPFSENIYGIGDETNMRLAINRVNGNVGIGTTDPMARLHVVGGTTLQGDVLVTGNLCVNGQKNAVVPTSQGMTKVYSEESAEVWFSDYGRARLVNGRCHVELPSLFLETVTISTEHAIMIFLQEEGECNGLIAVPGLTGFDVVEKGDGHSAARFSYRVVAKRKGYENSRFEVAASTK